MADTIAIRQKLYQYNNRYIYCSAPTHEDCVSVERMIEAERARQAEHDSLHMRDWKVYNLCHINFITEVL